jgi:hypothetical protein
MASVSGLIALLLGWRFTIASKQAPSALLSG